MRPLNRRAILVLLGLVLSASLLCACGDDPPTGHVAPRGEAGPLSEGPEVLLRMVEPVTVLVLPKRGDYALFWAAINEAHGVLKRNNISLVGSPRCAFHDFPRPEETPVDERLFEVWLPVPENILAPPGFQLREEAGGRAAYMTFKGPITPESTPDHQALFDFIYGRGLQPAGPVVEVYNWDVNTPAEEYITEIYVLVSEPPAETEIPTTEIPVEEPLEEPRTLPRSSR